MTFLHSIILSVLAAATIPVLLHLLSRRRMPLIEFSTLEFLRKLQKKKSRKVQLKQILLLIIRTLAIICLVLVFARPALRNSQAAGSASSTEIFLLVDDCMNSLTETLNGQLSRLINNQAEDILKLVGNKDNITLIPLSNPQKHITVAKGQIDLIRDRLSNSEPSYSVPNLSEATIQVDSILANSTKFNRELYFLSGFYSPLWDSISWTETSETERRYLVSSGADKNFNLSIDDIKINSSILQKGAPVEIAVLLTNNGGKSTENTLVSIYIEGERIAQSNVNVSPYSTLSLPFTIVPPQSGQLACSAKIEDIDPFAADNRRWFTLDVPDSIRVLSVVSDNLTIEILKAVFAPSETEFIHMDWTNLDLWETRSYSKYDVIILAGIKNVSAGAADRLTEFVNRGGGLILFQSEDADLAGLSRGLWKKLGFSGVKGYRENNETAFGKLDTEHPIFYGMFDDKGNPRSPRFNFSVDLVLGEKDQIIIPFSDSRPFLIERQKGHGKILMYAVPLSVESGNFVYSGLLAPLIVRSVTYVSSNNGNDALNWQTGNAYQVILPLPETKSIQMHLPNEEVTELPARPVVGGVEYDISNVPVPGIYDMRISDKILARYAANIPNNHSKLERRDLSTVSERLGKTIILEHDSENIQDQILNSRFGKELWFPIAIIFLVLLLSESILGKSGNKEETSQ